MRRKKQISSPFSLFSFQDIITATTGILILLALILALSVVVQKSAPAPAAAEDISDLVALHDAVVKEVEQIKSAQTVAQDANQLAAQYSPEELKNKLATAQSANQIDMANQAAMAAQKQAMEKEFAESNISDVVDDLEKKLAATSAQITNTQKKMQELQAGNRVVYNFHDTASSPYVVQIDGTRTLTGKSDVSQAPRVDNTVRTFIDFAKSLPAQDRYFLLLVKPSGISRYNLMREYLDDMNADVGVELIGESTTAVDLQTGATLK